MIDLRAKWDRLVERTGTAEHGQHFLATVMLLDGLSDGKRAGWIGRHRVMLMRAVAKLEGLTL